VPLAADLAAGPLVARVLPDVAGIDKVFDYLVPAAWVDEMRIGDLVRIDLHGRRVGGWVVALDVEPPPGLVLRPVAKRTGRGPAEEVLDLAGWAAWRWAGRRAQLLRTASPPGAVHDVPEVSGPGEAVDLDRGTARLADPPAWDAGQRQALDLPRGVLRLAPTIDRFPLALAAATAPSPVSGGRTLILCPVVDEARRLADRLSRAGVATAVVAADRRGAAGAGAWARAAGGATVVGARAGAWAPVHPLGRVVVFDEHDEAYQEERSPTWHARDVAVERARRAGVPCLLVSPCPTLEALDWGELLVVPAAAERHGWPHVTVVDQRQADPALGPLFSADLVDLVRGEGRVVCILNRLGRVRLLACAACGTLARCERCDSAVEQPERGTLRCRRCGTERPPVCLACGASRLKNLRLGVSRAREELEALVGEPVGEVTSSSTSHPPSTRVHIGTEAALHRVTSADAVAFLDFDQELLAPRYRAAEQAMGMLARAARLVRSSGAGARAQAGRIGRPGRIVVQTRSPDHPVLQAVRHADPERLVASEAPMRRALRLPPAAAMAVVSGQAAPAFIEALGDVAGVEVQGPVDGSWRLRAVDHPTLCNALAAVARPSGRLRVEVDPLRI